MHGQYGITVSYTDIKDENTYITQELRDGKNPNYYVCTIIGDVLNSLLYL